MTQATYHIIWHSPRGFGNEGIYLVGTAEGLLAYQNRFFTDNGTQKWWPETKRGGTKVAMLEKAEKKAAKDIRGYRNDGDRASISVEIVDDDGDICR